MMKDIKTVFQYHGAEHKTIHCFENNLELTPENMIRELQGFERWFFRLVFAGGAAKKLYRLFEYRTD